MPILLFCFPKYTYEEISLMQYNLLKWRYLQPNDNMAATLLLFFNQHLQKDLTKGTPDRYPNQPTNVGM